MNSRSIITPAEKNCLKELIAKYPAVSSIETNHSFLREKKTAWEILTNEFNSIGENQKRTQAQLKKCWDNMKSKRKAELCEEKRSRMKTGGGRLSPCHRDTEEFHPADSVLDMATNIELSFCSDSDHIVCDSYDGAAMPSTSSSGIPWTDQSTEAPVPDLTTDVTRVESFTPQQPPIHCALPKQDMRRPSVTVQELRGEAKVRVLRTKTLVQQEEQVHQVRMKTAQKQLQVACSKHANDEELHRITMETAQKQFQAACLQVKQLELQNKQLELQNKQLELQNKQLEMEIDMKNP